MLKYTFMLFKRVQHFFFDNLRDYQLIYVLFNWLLHYLILFWYDIIITKHT